MKLITISDVTALPSAGTVKHNSTVPADGFDYLPESEGFWEWRADGTLTIKRPSSTGTSNISAELKVRDADVIRVNPIKRDIV